jgi:succinyl-CoA synthetase beta subunit
MKLSLDPLQIYTVEKFTEVFRKNGGNLPQIDAIARLAHQMYAIYNQFDLLLLEINPLAILTNGEIRLADVKLEVDDSALFRQPHFKQYQQMTTDPLELEALRIGVNFVRLNGNVALIASGAGLNMNAMEYITSTGLEAANFLDTGGGITAQMMIDSMKLVARIPSVKAILFSVYGVSIRWWKMAKGVVAGMKVFATRYHRGSKSNGKLSGRMLEHLRRQQC